MDYSKLPDLERIRVVGVKDYYAGDNGVIYKAKCIDSSIRMIELSAQYPDDKYKIQYVNIKIFNEQEGISNKLFAVHWLVKVSFDSPQPYGFKVIWKDRNYNNNSLKNLEWDYDPKNLTKNIYIFK